MNYANNPELLDRLGAAYALGSLRGGARRRFETLARQNPRIRASALLWQERLSGMTELAYQKQPSPQLWLRIENLVTAERMAQQNALALAQQNSLLQRLSSGLRRWRFAATIGGLGTAAAVVLALNLNTLSNEVGQLQARLKAAPEIHYVAVLSDEKSAASVLVTFDPKNQKLTLKRVGDFQESADKSLQLWALPQGGKPQSLAVMSTERVIKLEVAETQVRLVPTLAISLEPKGGVPSAGGPTGPVLFKGALLETPL